MRFDPFFNCVFVSLVIYYESAGSEVGSWSLGAGDGSGFDLLGVGAGS